MPKSDDLEDYRRRREDAPLSAVRNSSGWAPVVRLFDMRAREKLHEQSGFSSMELDEIERSAGVQFPMVLREWWRLAGKHPFVDRRLDVGSDCYFRRPTDQDIGSQSGLTIVAVDDGQTGIETGIHDDFLNELDPVTHGRNPISDLKRMLPDEVYAKEFIVTGLSVPALIHVTLMCHLCMAGGVTSGRNLPASNANTPNLRLITGLDLVQPLKQGHSVHGKEIAALKLYKSMHTTAFGEVYTNGQDIIFFWLAGYLCASKEATQRVRAVIGSCSRNTARSI